MSESPVKPKSINHDRSLENRDNSVSLSLSDEPIKPAYSQLQSNFWVTEWVHVKASPDFILEER